MIRRRVLTLLLWPLLSPAALAQQYDPVETYANVLVERGQEPIPFILEKLNHYELILFDDALHTAVEPFEFYQDLIENVAFQEAVQYVFLEVVSINHQTALDAYFQSEVDDVEILYPAFQNDFSGTGWPYQTYFQLLQTIWNVNNSLPVKDRIQVIAVNSPTYWKEIRDPRDVELFRLSLEGNDYTMYKTILSSLERFRAGKKGIFLTNTRHAYKGIKTRENEYYLNCGTFFSQRHPGKTYSVRFHNINLRLVAEKAVDSSTPRTTEGLEDVVVEWVRMEDGLWDSAFERYGNRPVAFDLKETPFGASEYVGNHMLNAAPGQTMYSAYDALVFLAPIETLHQTAMVGFIYTGAYKKELERRVGFLYTQEQIDEMVQGYGVSSVGEFLDSYFTYKPEILQPLARDIGPIDAWKTRD